MQPQERTETISSVRHCWKPALRFFGLGLLVLLAACGKVRSADPISEQRDATPPVLDAALTPPPSCIAPCLWEAMRRCSAPKPMHSCLRSGEAGPDFALCDPASGWSLSTWNGGQAGSGLLLAHDGVTCLQTRGGGAAPIGEIFYDASGQIIAIETNKGSDRVTICGSSFTGPTYPQSAPGAAECSSWQLDPMAFDCDSIAPGTCDPVTRPF